ncbi:MAG: hypothetical protein A3H42_03505 [Deltaproteobacteria bacterium RIFCSPLOWO2_02_FULL_46_8]|nr:MAG: hypothetical protein A3H42_03505 [Deltaproteobacteria bacterium RIFCSPLOWO2_02_FULL_46_8]
MQIAHLFDKLNGTPYNSSGMKYRLDPVKFKKRVSELGYQSILEFARKSAIHRNTVQKLLGGDSIFLSSFEKIAEKLEMDPLELMMPTVKLDPSIPNLDELESIVPLLSRKNKKMAIVLIGSRAFGNPKKYSDWDVGIFGHPQPISGMEYLALKRFVEEKTENHVRQVDLVNLNQAPLWFLENLKKPLVFLGGNKESYYYLQGWIDGICKENKAA